MQIQIMKHYYWQKMCLRCIFLDILYSFSEYIKSIFTKAFIRPCQTHNKHFFFFLKLFFFGLIDKFHSVTIFCCRAGQTRMFLRFRANFIHKDLLWFFRMLKKTSKKQPFYFSSLDVEKEPKLLYTAPPVTASQHQFLSPND